MTITSQTTRKQYAGTAVPASEYPVTFQFLDSADLVVKHTATDGAVTTLGLDTDYTVSGGGGENGTVTVTNAGYRAGAGEYLTIYLDADLKQETDLQNLTTFYPEVIERMGDRLTLFSQQLQEQLDRAMIYSPETPEGEYVNVADLSDEMQAYVSEASGSASTASDAADAALSAREAAETARDQAQAAAVHEHALLTNRDAPDSHPIAAITGLQSALDGKLTPDGDGSGLSGVTKPGDLGTAAALDTGTSEGDIPVLGVDGKLPSSVMDSFPSGAVIFFDGDVVPSGWTETTVSGLIPDTDTVNPVFTSSDSVSPEEASNSDWTLTCDSNVDGSYPVWRMMDGINLESLSFASSLVYTPPVIFTLENTNGDEFSFDSYSICCPNLRENKTPTGWDIEYWDGSSWQTGDSRTGIIWVDETIQYFNCPQRVTTTKIRLVTTEMKAGATKTQLGELTLYKDVRCIKKD